MSLIYNSLYILNKNPWKFKYISYNDRWTFRYKSRCEGLYFYQSGVFKQSRMTHYFKPIHKL